MIALFIIETGKQFKWLSCNGTQMVERMQRNTGKN